MNRKNGEKVGNILHARSRWKIDFTLCHFIFWRSFFMVRWPNPKVLFQFKLFRHPHPWSLWIKNFNSVRRQWMGKKSALSLKFKCSEKLINGKVYVWMPPHREWFSMFTVEARSEKISSFCCRIKAESWRLKERGEISILLLMQNQHEQELKKFLFLHRRSCHHVL